MGEKIEKGSKGIYIPGNKSAVPKLSLLLGKDSFFCVHIDAHQRLTFYRTARKSSFKQSVIEWLEESIRLSELLKESKLEVWVGLIQPHYTFVPVPLYQEEHRDLYAQRAFLHSVPRPQLVDVTEYRGKMRCGGTAEETGFFLQ